MEGTNINICLIFVQRELGINYDCIPCYFVVRILKWGLYIYNSLDLVMTLSHSKMCMCVPVVSFYDSYWILSFISLSNHIDTSHFLKASWRSYSHDVDNLTYLDGYCLFSVCELKEDSQFTVLWFTRTKDFLCFSCFIVLNWVLVYVVVCASHSCTTNGNPFVCL